MWQTTWGSSTRCPVVATCLFLLLHTTSVVLATTREATNKLPFEAVFQGLCESSELCDHLCFNLHDGTFECDCRSGYKLDPDGYTCSKLNETKTGSSILYEKEASFVAVLDEDYQSDSPYREDASSQSDARLLKGPARTDPGGLDVSSLRGPAPRAALLQENLEGRATRLETHQLIDRADLLNYDRYRMSQDSKSEKDALENKINSAFEDELGEEEEEEEEGTFPETFLGADIKGTLAGGVITSPEPNLEQKVPSAQPDVMATESLLPQCALECGAGRCHIQGVGVPRCRCPLGTSGRLCRRSAPVHTARFHGDSWLGFAPLREAYRDVQLTLEFLPQTLDGVLLVSGENDDLSGDFMAAVIVAGFVEFRWDCGSGSGAVRSPKKAQLGEWNRLTVYRHRWDVWLQLNDGHHVQGRSEGLFSRITFREPLYLGGTYNLTSLTARLGVMQGFQGCVRRLQVNDHVYRFHKQQHGWPLDEEEEESSGADASISYDFAAIDGWDITECLGDACSEVECRHGGKCVATQATTSTQQDSSNTSHFPATPITPVAPPPAPICLCPLGYVGDFCEKQLNLEVPSFNGSSHLVFPALGGSALSWLELEVVFKSSLSDGVLLYEGQRPDGTGDLLAFTLSRAHLHFTIDLGSGPLTLRSLYPIRAGVWHSAKVSRTGRRAWLYIDDQPIVTGLTPGGFTMLSLSHPMFLGGIPPSFMPPTSLPATQPYVGCIQKLAVNNRVVPLVSGAVSGSNMGSCEHPCSTSPCQNGGTCQPQGSSYTCHCPLGFKDDHCKSRIVTQAAAPSFNGRSYLRYNNPEIMKRISGDRLHLWLRFRTTSPNGLLVWTGEDQYNADSDDALSVIPIGDSLSIYLQQGLLVLQYNLGSGRLVLTYKDTWLADGNWHTIRVDRMEREGRLSVDGGHEIVGTAPGTLVQLNVASALYVGGRETVASTQHGSEVPGFQGCIADLTLATDYHVDLISQAAAGQNIGYC